MGSGTRKAKVNTGAVLERTRSGRFIGKPATRQTTGVSVPEVVIKQEKADEEFGGLYSHLVSNEGEVVDSVDKDSLAEDSLVDDKEMNWDSSPASGKHQMDSITPSPSSKKAKRDFSGVKEIIPPLTSMRWVHPTMKEDLEKAFRGTDKHFNNACNFWFRYIMWKKKDLTKIDKDHFSQAAFGTLATQLTYSEDGSARANEPIGVRIHRQWSLYAKNIFRELRKHMEALLRMFLESSEVRPIVDAIFYSVKARGVESIRTDMPCVSPTEIRDKFLKGNIRLVSDAWYPIIDAAPPDFLLEHPIWSQRFLDATCTVLSWMLTYFFRIVNAEEMIGFEIGNCPISPSLMTACICKADAGLPTDFPLVNKPIDWRSRKCPTTPYGELKFINIARETAMCLLEDEIDRELSDPESGVVMPKPGGVGGSYQELLNFDTVFDQADWLVNCLRARGIVARNLESESRKVAMHLEEKCESTLSEFQNHMDALKGPGDNMQRRFLTEGFLRDAKKMFHDALHREQGAGIGYTGRNGEVISSVEVMGGFAAWVSLLRKEKYFTEMVSNYNFQAWGVRNGFGYGMTVGGNLGIQQGGGIGNPQWGTQGQSMGYGGMGVQQYNQGMGFGGQMGQQHGVVNPQNGQLMTGGGLLASPGHQSMPVQQGYWQTQFQGQQFPSQGQQGPQGQHFPGQGQQGQQLVQRQQFPGQGQQGQQGQQLVQEQQFPSQGQQGQQGQQLVQEQQFPSQGQQGQQGQQLVQRQQFPSQGQQLVQRQQFPSQGNLVEQSFHGQVYGQEQLQAQIQVAGVQQPGQVQVQVQGQQQGQGQGQTVQGQQICVQEQLLGPGKFAGGQFHVRGMCAPQAEMGLGHGISVQNTGNLQPVNQGLSGVTGMEGQNPSLGQPEARGYYVNQWQGEAQTGNRGIQAQSERSTNQIKQNEVFGGINVVNGGNQGGERGLVSTLEEGLDPGGGE